MKDLASLLDDEDAAPGFATLHDMEGLKADGTLAFARTQSWYRQYLDCGTYRAWSSREQSDDAQAFGAMQQRVLYERGRALQKTLREMEARVRSVRARPFREPGAPPR